MVIVEQRVQATCAVRQSSRSIRLHEELQKRFEAKLCVEPQRNAEAQELVVRDALRAVDARQKRELVLLQRVDRNRVKLNCATCFSMLHSDDGAFALEVEALRAVGGGTGGGARVARLILRSRIIRAAQRAASRSQDPAL